MPIESSTSRAARSGKKAPTRNCSTRAAPSPRSPSGRSPERSMEHDQNAFLRDTLSRFGASGDVLDALLAYTANPFDIERLDLPSLQLADQPHIEAWEDYLRESQRD